MDWNAVVEAIQKEILQIREEYVVENAIIRDGVFKILEKYCTVLYYPLEEERNCGFHIKKIVKERLEDFVYINTAKPVETQVFTAAHELGHIWRIAERVWESLGCKEVLGKKLEEDITNRFAAELLMPDDIFKRTFEEYGKEKIQDSFISEDDLVRIIVSQMDDFLVPYDAVRKRLRETDIINDKIKIYMKENHGRIIKKVEMFSQDQNSYLDKNTMVKTIPGIRGLIERAESEDVLDKVSLTKIKRDFGIEDTDETGTMEIHIGKDSDGENTGIS